MVLLSLALGVFSFLFHLILRSFDRIDARLNQQNQSLQAELLQMSRQMNEQSRSNTAVVQDCTRLMGDFQNRLGQLQESTQSMIRMGEDIIELQDILKSPKLRGILGESFLEELLRELLPQDRFVLQYAFKSGEKVDAVILLGQGMVPVDAKFPLESLRRLLQASSEEEKRKYRRQFAQDVKGHIEKIAAKYIIPEEGTFDFALMYLPAENIYYETMVREEDYGEGQSLAQYALSRKVIPVSPNSFYAYLQAIVFGLRGLRIETCAREILGSLGQLATDFQKFYDDFERLGSHLGNSKTTYDKAQKRLDRLQHQLQSIESPAPIANPPERISSL